MPAAARPDGDHARSQPRHGRAERFAGYRAAGVNRLSLGIQSFEDRYLRALGRIMLAPKRTRPPSLALTHFESVNFDLIAPRPARHGPPAADLRTAIAPLSLQHLSCYHLTLELNTPFHHNPPARLPDGDVAADMQQMVETLLADAGYQHYETSAFAQPGKRCRHLNYWTFGDYLGIGAARAQQVSPATPASCARCATSIRAPIWRLTAMATSLQTEQGLSVADLALWS